jgi:hypothetical protein
VAYCDGQRAVGVDVVLEGMLATDLAVASTRRAATVSQASSRSITWDPGECAAHQIQVTRLVLAGADAVT